MYTFTIINYMGNVEMETRIGVTKEVFILEKKNFANPITSGERERCSHAFVRRDQFIN